MGPGRQKRKGEGWYLSWGRKAACQVSKPWEGEGEVALSRGWAQVCCAGYPERGGFTWPRTTPGTFAGGELKEELGHLHPLGCPQRGLQMSR